MDPSDRRRATGMRAVAVLIVGGLALAAMAGLPAVAAKKGLTRAKALKLFYTRAQADARFLDVAEGDGRFVNTGEKASDADKLDGVDGQRYGETLWAMMESDGTFVRGRGVALTFGTFPIATPGGYEIVFDRNISSCAYQATVIDTAGGRGNTAPGGEIGVRPLSTSPETGLSITTRDSAGAVSGRDFVVVVHC